MASTIIYGIIRVARQPTAIMPLMHVEVTATTIAIAKAWCEKTAGTTLTWRTVGANLEALVAPGTLAETRFVIGPLNLLNR